MLEGVADAVMANLPACRSEWWATHGERHGIGLANKRVETKPVPGGDGILAKIALVPGQAAVGIVSAAYMPTVGVPAANEVVLVRQDGRELRLTPGQHIEEAEEW